MKKLSINVKGSFALSESSSTQCGRDGQRAFNYEVRISGYSCDVNNKGFLFDNAVIMSYFENYIPVDSCEDIALVACDHFIEVLGPKVSLQEVYVKIIPNERAFLECHWSPMTHCMRQLSEPDHFEFGKYAGKTVAQVIRIDPQYILWLLDNADKNGFIPDSRVVRKAIKGISELETLRLA